MENMNEEEAVSVLKCRTGQPKNAAMTELAKELGYLPLALAQAGAYITQTNINAKEYLKRFRKMTKQHMAERPRQLAQETQIVLVVWLMSMEEMSLRCPESVDVLALMAYLHPSDIAAKIIPFLAKTIADSFDVNAISSCWKDFSMVDFNIDSETYHVHALLQNALQIQSTESQISDLGYVGDALVDLHAEEQNLQITPLRQHLISVISHMERCDFDDMVLPKLFFALGFIYADAGASQDCLMNMTEGLRIFEEYYGENHWSISIPLVKLATACAQLGDLDAMKKYLERALRLKEDHFGRDDWQLFAILESLAKVYGALGDVSAQKKCLDRMLVIEKSRGKK
eukprot:TRINITY_DN10787_c0_g1_i1.p1 TRINITY_DN10787_c0_g1~~TRINITY_DN10787_c0_g1_i1.p1  ORF type:complete len:400 (-),score=84.17 TRINITY_DN10787_c0_g1_i1:269-1294(-)